ncbi:MAG: ATP-dependent Clp protease proteolytic subunit, partial [Saprospiraceae bacterium]
MHSQNEFKKFAVGHMGMSSMHLDKFMETSVPDINGFTPQVIEERQMNIVGMDVFSRLMMDRIIFMGVPVNDYVANVIQAQLLFLESTDPKRDIQMFIN